MKWVLFNVNQVLHDFKFHVAFIILLFLCVSCNSLALGEPLSRQVMLKDCIKHTKEAIKSRTAL